MTMIQHIRRLACVAAVAIAGLTLASPAQAQMTLTITDVDTGAKLVLNDSGTGYISSTPQTLGNYSILSISTSANYDGNSDHIINTGDANVLNTVLRVTQTGTTDAPARTNSDSLTVQVTTYGSASWSIPTGNPVLLSSTLAVSELDGSNGNSSGSFATFASTLTSGATTTTVDAPNAYGKVTTTNSGPAGNPTPPFYLNNLLAINTTAVPQVVNLSAVTDATALPEPSSFVMAGVVALGLMGYGLRRKARGA